MSATGTEADPDPDSVESDGNEVWLTVPATTDRLNVARQALARFAGRLESFGPAEVDDLEVAVGEICRQMLDACGAGTDLALRFSARGREVSVTVECRCDSPSPDASVLSQQVFVALVDEYQVSHDGGLYSYSFLKRARLG